MAEQYENEVKVIITADGSPARQEIKETEKAIREFREKAAQRLQNKASNKLNYDKRSLDSTSKSIKESISSGVSGGVAAGVKKSKSTILKSTSSLGSSVRSAVSGAVAGNIAGSISKKRYDDEWKKLLESQGYLLLDINFKPKKKEADHYSLQYKEIVDKIYDDNESYIEDIAVVPYELDDLLKDKLKQLKGKVRKARLRSDAKSFKLSDLYGDAEDDYDIYDYKESLKDVKKAKTSYKDKMRAASQKINNNYNLKKWIYNTDSEPYKGEELPIKVDEKKVSGLKKVLSSLSKTLGGKLGNALGLKGFGRTISSVINTVEGLGIQLGKLVPVLGAIIVAIKLIKLLVASIKKTISFVFNTTKKIASAVAKVTAEMIKASVAVGKLIGKLGLLEFKAIIASISALGKAFVSTLSGVGKIIKYSVINPLLLGLKSALTLFKKIFSLWTISFSTAMGSAYSWGQINNNVLVKSLDLITTDIYAILNALASMVLPIINSIAPIVDNITDKVLVLTNAIAKLLAQLSGKTTYVKVTKAAKEFTDANNAAAASLQKVLLNIDELNKLDDKTGGSGIADAFAEEATAIEKIDFDAFVVGAQFGEKIMQMLNAIDWASIKKKASDIGTRLAEVINGIFSTKNLGSTFGTSLAEIINTAFSFLESYVTTINVKSIAKQISDLVKSFFTGIDYLSIDTTIKGLALNIVDAFNTYIGDLSKVDAVANSIGKLFKSAIAGVTILLNGLNIKQLVDNVTKEINGLFSDKDSIQTLTDSIFNFLYKAVSGVLALLSNIQWENVVDSFIKSINSLFTDADRINLLAESIHNLFNKAVTNAAKLLNDINWTSIVSSLITMLNKTLGDKENILLITDSIFNMLNKAVQSVIKLVKDLQWENVIDAIVQSINKLVRNKERSDKIAEDIYYMFEKACNVVTKTIINIDWNKVVDNVTTYMSNAIKALDGTKVGDAIITLFNAALNLAIKAPWAELAKFGSDVIWRIISEMPTVFKNVSGTEVANKMSEVLNIIIDDMQPSKIASAVNAFVQWVGDFWQTIQDKVNWKELVDKLTEAIKLVDWAAAFEKVFVVIAKCWVYDKIFKFNVIKTLVEDIIEDFKTNIAKKISDITGIGEDFAKKLVNGIAQGVKTWLAIVNPFYPITAKLESLKKAWNSFKSLFSSNDYDDYSNYSGYNSGYRTFATGGVVYKPTAAIVGEYAGASSNPEIITPENKMREIFAEGNSSLANVYLQVGRQIIAAIENQSLEVSIGDDTIAKSAARGNNSYRKITGLSLFA